jgi:hypothetical protein
MADILARADLMRAPDQTQQVTVGYLIHGFPEEQVWNWSDRPSEGFPPGDSTLAWMRSNRGSCGIGRFAGRVFNPRDRLWCSKEKAG